MLQYGMDKIGVGAGREMDSVSGQDHARRYPSTRQGDFPFHFSLHSYPHNETESAAEISGGALLLRQFFHHHHIRVDFF